MTAEADDQQTAQPTAPPATSVTRRRRTIRVRREEQYALLDEHRRLTAQLQALNERFHALELELVESSRERRERLLVILEDEMLLLREARALDADIRRVFLDEAPLADTATRAYEARSSLSGQRAKREPQH